jgi:hypothetical protein
MNNQGFLYLSGALENKEGCKLVTLHALILLVYKVWQMIDAFGILL